jgi:hypothetical protein
MEEFTFVATVLVTAYADTKIDAQDAAHSVLLGDHYTVLDIRQATPDEVESQN